MPLKSELISLEANRLLSLYYRQSLEALARLAYQSKQAGILDLSKPIRWSDFPPERRREAEGILTSLHARLSNLYQKGTQSAWLSGEKQAIQQNRTLQMTPEARKRINASNRHLIKDLQTRKVGGLSVSSRVWGLIEDAEGKLELSLQAVLNDPKASRDPKALSRAFLRKLQNPDEVMKSLREGNQHETLQRAKQLFGRGVGIYRDPLKNIERLFRTEITKANREAQWQMFQQNPYITGFRIKRSGRRVDGKPLPCPLCDKLQGVYPKSFRFSVWHPHCECVMEPIFGSTKDPEFVAKVNQSASRGVDAVRKLENPEAIKQMPKEMLDFAQRAMRPNAPSGVSSGVSSGKGASGLSASLLTPAGKVPALFIQENAHLLRPHLNPSEATNKPIAPASPAPQPEPTALERAKARHANRTPEQIQAIKDKWQQRQEEIRITHKMANNILNVAKGYSEVDYSELQSALETRDLKIIKEATKRVAMSVLEMKKEEEALSSLIPDVREWHRLFTLKELKGAFERVEHTLSSMPDDLEGRKSKLLFEIEWVEDHRFPGWSVAKASYKKELKRVERKIREADLSSRVSKPIEMARTSRSKEFKALADEMRTMLQTPNFDIREARELASKLIEKQTELEDRINGNTKRVKIPTSKPLKRETLDELKLRFGENLPKTLPNLDKAIKDYERSSKYGEKASMHKEDIESLMRDVFDKHDFGMNIKEDIIEKVLTSWFKNTFEVGGGNGYVGSTKTKGKIETDHGRLVAAHKLFGLSKKLGVDQLERKEYEKYGNLLDHNILESLRNNTATQYGVVEVRFKKDKVVTTWTAGDSLNQNWQPSLCSDPKASSFDNYFRTPTERDIDITDLNKFKRNHIAGYLELQFHGELTVDCVESLAFPYNLASPYRTYEHEVAMKWKQAGAKVYFINDNGELDQL